MRTWALNCVTAAVAACGCVAVCAEPPGPFTPEPPLPSAPAILWDQMSPQQRIAFWPLMTRQERILCWRRMRPEERSVMKGLLEPADLGYIRHRFAMDAKLIGEAHERLREIPRRVLSDGERRLLRRQVREVYMRIRRGGGYDCADPTDCRPLPAHREHR